MRRSKPVRSVLITGAGGNLGQKLISHLLARDWCERSGIPWLGRADIGHDVHNKVVPFGRG